MFKYEDYVSITVKEFLDYFKQQNIPVPSNYYKNDLVRLYYIVNEFGNLIKNDDDISKCLVNVATDPEFLFVLLINTNFKNRSFFIDDTYKKLLDTTHINKCARNLIVQKRLGKGTYGFVDSVCIKDHGCEYTIKTQSFIEDTKYDLHYQTVFWNEVCSLHYVNKKNPNIAPIVYAAWECVEDNIHYGVYLMEKFDGSLEDFSQDLPKEKEKLDKLVNKAIKQIEHLNDIYVINGDLKLANVLYKKNKVKLGDWGFAKVFKVEPDKNSSKDRYKRYGFYTKKYFKRSNFFNVIAEFSPTYDLSMFAFTCLFRDLYSIFPESQSYRYIDGPLYLEFKKYSKKTKASSENDWRAHMGWKIIRKRDIYSLLKIANYNE